MDMIADPITSYDEIIDNLRAHRYRPEIDQVQ